MRPSLSRLGTAEFANGSKAGSRVERFAGVVGSGRRAMHPHAGRPVSMMRTEWRAGVGDRPYGNEILQNEAKSGSIAKSHVSGGTRLVGTGGAGGRGVPTKRSQVAECGIDEEMGDRRSMDTANEIRGYTAAAEARWAGTPYR